MPPTSTRSRLAARAAGLLALGLLLAAGWWAAGRQDRLRAGWARWRHPRIVLVTFDTLHLEFAGPTSEWADFTPHLDAFAAAGTLFRQAYTTAPLTLPSHASLLTGRTPESLGVMVNGDVLADEAVTLAEILGAAGYRTAAFTSLGVLRRHFNLSQGFDHYDDGFEKPLGRWYRTADEVVDAALPWVRRAADEPFFAWVHLSDPHEPYVVKGAPPDTRLTLDGRPLGDFNLTSKQLRSVGFELPPGRHRLAWETLRPWRGDDWTATSLRVEVRSAEALRPWLADPATDLDRELALRPDAALELLNPGPGAASIELSFTGRLDSPPRSEVWEQYRLETEFADAQLGRLEAELAALGLAEGTLWILASDHGEGLYRQGILGHADFAHEDQLRVFWILRGPGVPAGREIDDGPVLMHDLLPTLLELLRLRPPEGIEGVPQTSCWSGAGCRAREEWWAYAADGGGQRITAVAGYRLPWKLLWQRHPRSGCYRLDEDPWEEVNLGKPFTRNPGAMPPDVLSLSERIEGERQRFQRLLDDRETVPLGDEQREMLRSLGYLGE